MALVDHDEVIETLAARIDLTTRSAIALGSAWSSPTTTSVPSRRLLRCHRAPAGNGAESTSYGSEYDNQRCSSHGHSGLQDRAEQFCL